MKCSKKNKSRHLRWHLLQPLAITFVLLWLGTMLMFTSNTCNEMETSANKLHDLLKPAWKSSMNITPRTMHPV